MTLEFKLLFDDVEFSVWQIGCWQYTRMKDGDGFWQWTGPEAQWQASPTKESLIQALKRLSKRSAAL